VKTILQGRAIQVAARYGDQAPMAAVCCNACRTCTTTNLLALATGAGLGALYAAGRFARRHAFWVNQHDASASR
jgi:hypothetical protein